MTTPPTDSAYIARLWDYPRLCVAVFGVQHHTPAGQAAYEAAGIDAQMWQAMEAAREHGLLLNRPLLSPEGPVLLQYWRSARDLHAWSRTQPHTAWWQWLIEHAGPDISFYHEIYDVAAGEAIFERGCRPVGPAQFSELEAVRTGEGRSRERMRRFAAAREAPPAGGDDTA